MLKFGTICVIIILLGCLQASLLGFHHSQQWIQTGNLNLHNLLLQKTNYSYTVTLPSRLYVQRQNKLAVAISIKQIEQYKTINGIDFRVMGQQVESTNMVKISALIFKDKSWRSIKLSYMMNIYPKIMIGTISVQNIESVSSQKQTISNEFSNLMVSQTESYGTQIFISGLISSTPQFQIFDINVEYLQSNQSLLINFQQKCISSVTFCYILYQITNSIFSFDSISNNYKYSFSGPKSMTNNQITDNFLFVQVLQEPIIILESDIQQKNVESIQQILCLENQIEIQGKCRQKCLGNGYINQQNQCQCLDGYYLKGQSCSECKIGEYYSRQLEACTQCSKFCNICSQKLTCIQCQSGFILQHQEIFGLIISFCSSVCGDGQISQVQECDDKNTQKFDGCDEKCVVQNQYFCYFNETLQSSQCMQQQSDKVYIEITRDIKFSNRSSVQFFLSKIPTCFDQNCTSCLFDIQIIKSPIPLKYEIQYFGDNRFIINFLYGERRLNSQFRFYIGFAEKLNTQCIDELQMRQQIFKTVDPSQI